MSGYHKNFIMKHSSSSIHKIKEEVEEFIDAHVSGNSIMAAQELSDIYLSLRNLTQEYGLTMSDLKIMANTTDAVFKSGCREESSLLDIIKSNAAYTCLNTYGIIWLICNDANYAYAFATDDDAHLIISDAIEYIEVISGTVTHKNESFDTLQIVGNSNRSSHIDFKGRGVVLLKKSGAFKTDFYASLSDNKSEVIFNTLKDILDENGDV